MLVVLLQVVDGTSVLIKAEKNFCKKKFWRAFFLFLRHWRRQQVCLLLCTTTIITRDCRFKQRTLQTTLQPTKQKFPPQSLPLSLSLWMQCASSQNIISAVVQWEKFFARFSSLRSLSLWVRDDGQNNDGNSAAAFLTHHYNRPWSWLSWMMMILGKGNCFFGQKTCFVYIDNLRFFVVEKKGCFVALHYASKVSELVRTRSKAKTRNQKLYDVGWWLMMAKFDSTPLNPYGQERDSWISNDDHSCFGLIFFFSFFFKP